MTEETDLTTETVTDIDEATEEASLASAMAPIALIAAATAGAVYFARKFRFGAKDQLELENEVIETTSEEA